MWFKGEAWPPSGTPILLHHFAVMFKNKETISEVPYSVPGPQSTFPLTTFLPAEKEAAELPSKEARSCGFPLRCHPSSNAASGRCVPSRCSLLAASKHNLEITEIGKDCVLRFWCREKRVQQNKENEP